MHAVVYRGKGEIGMEERPMPHIEEDTDAILRVTLTTICTSDLHIRNGAVPRAVPGIILGHEFVGVVEETGRRVKNVRPGQRVAVNVETFCGECFFCKRGFVNNCEDKNGGWALGCRIDGGQAEYVRIPFADQALTPIPDQVTDEQALFTGDLLSTGYWAAKIGEIKKGDTVLVLGAGPAGMCAMMCAALYSPARIVAADIDESRLAFARRHGLADDFLNPANVSVPDALRERTQGRGADVVIEAAGGKDSFQLAWQAARPNAVVVVAAMYEEDQLLPLPEMYGKNLIFKTGGVDACSCREILELTAQGRLKGECLITHRAPLEDAMEMYRLFERKEDGVIKVALTP